MGRTPQSFGIDVNGKLYIDWGASSPALQSAQVQTINGLYPMWFAVESTAPADADLVVALANPGADTAARGVILSTRNAFISTQESQHEVAIPPDSRVLGTFTPAVVRWHTPDPAGTPTRTGINFFVGGLNSQTNTVPETITTLSQYEGPITDVRLTDTPRGTPAVPNIVFDSDKVTFQFSGGRYIFPGAQSLSTQIAFQRNGSAVTPTNISIVGVSGGSEIRATFPSGTFQGTDSVQVGIRSGSILAGSLSNSVGAQLVYGTDFGNTGDLLDAIPGEFTAVQPEISGAFPLVVNSSGFLTVLFNVPVDPESGSVQVLRDSGLAPLIDTFNVLSTNGNTLTLNPASGIPIFEGETVSVNTIPAGVVSNAVDNSLENDSINASAFTVINGSDVAVPDVNITSATINPSGNALILVFQQNTSYLGGSGTVNPTHSPVGSQNWGNLLAGDGTPTLSFALNNLDQIRNFDTVNVNIPAGVFKTTSNLSGGTQDSIINRSVVNNSTVPFNPPTYFESFVDPIGSRIRIVFTDTVVIDQTTLLNNLQVVATDISSGDSRTFFATGTPFLDTTTVTNDTVVVDISGNGLIYDNSNAPDGDNVTINTQGVSGIVIDEDSFGPGPQAYSLLPPINDEVPTNNSTVEEPSAPVVPDYVEAEVYDVGSNQFLRIRFDDGTSPLIIQLSQNLPTLQGSVSGNISLSFNSIVDGAGDNDEIVYIVVGEKLKRTSDETASLTVNANIVVSQISGTPNAAESTITEADASFTNSSTQALPEVPNTAPILQQATVGTSGNTIGLFYDVPILNGPSKDIEITTSQQGVLDVTSTKKVSSTLLVVTLDKVIFAGERVTLSLGSGFAINQSNNLSSTPSFNILASNNSRIAFPSGPTVDSALLNDPGTILTVSFNQAIINNNLPARIISSKSGNHTVVIDSVSENVATINVSGIVFEDETVSLILPIGFVTEFQFGISSNKESITVVDVSGRTSGAPDLPSIGEDLNE